ncbi:translation initiation factor IF-2 subunit gamma [Candidatus Micrarchaeota archaeon]|nr:translation initiation factor IF-2 subunit gamma [Candidatus Micrarchaeota archaeon]
MLEQAEVNIGTAGHVDHGKTSLVKALTGTWTDRHSEEIKRGITIRLGYADAVFYECGSCSGFGRFSNAPRCAQGHECKPLRRVSFVDCPGHEALMAVMITGTAIMDGCILVIAANESVPQPQTQEHLNILNMSGIRNIVIAQNKVDLVSKEEALKNRQQIEEFVRGSVAENAPIIPVAAHYNVNIDALIAAIQESIPTPKRDAKKKFTLLSARSFDINKPGTGIEKLRGGVIGGSVTSGEVSVGDEIEIGPGIEVKGEFKPLRTKVTSLSTSTGIISTAKPGGLIGIGTSLDPSLTKSDSLVGSVVTKSGELPPVTRKLTIDAELFSKTIAVPVIEKIKPNEPIVVNIRTAMTVGIASEVRSRLVTLNLKKAVCAEKGERVALSRKIGSRWALIGHGTVQ